MFCGLIKNVWVEKLSTDISLNADIIADMIQLWSKLVKHLKSCQMGNMIMSEMIINSVGQ